MRPPARTGNSDVRHPPVHAHAKAMEQAYDNARSRWIAGDASATPRGNVRLENEQRVRYEAEEAPHGEARARRSARRGDDALVRHRDESMQLHKMDKFALEEQRKSDGDFLVCRPPPLPPSLSPGLHPGLPPCLPPSLPASVPSSPTPRAPLEGRC